MAELTPEEREVLSKLRALAPNGEHVDYLRQALTLAAVWAADEQVRAFAQRVARGDEETANPTGSVGS